MLDFSSPHPGISVVTPSAAFLELLARGSLPDFARIATDPDGATHALGTALLPSSPRRRKR